MIKLEKFLHSICFANPVFLGDGSGGGRMTGEKLSEILCLISAERYIRGFMIAEYLPFDEYRINRMFSGSTSSGIDRKNEMMNIIRNLSLYLCNRQLQYENLA